MHFPIVASLSDSSFAMDGMQRQPFLPDRIAQAHSHRAVLLPSVARRVTILDRSPQKDVKRESQSLRLLNIFPFSYVHGSLDRANFVPPIAGLAQG